MMSKKHGVGFFFGWGGEGGGGGGGGGGGNKGAEGVGQEQWAQ